MRRHVVLAGLTVFLLLMSLVAGCELLNLDFTMDVDYHTTVETSGNIIQEIRIELVGAEGTGIDTTDFVNEIIGGTEGWVLDTEYTDDSVVISGVANYILDDDGNISQVEGGPAVPEGFSLRVEDGLLSRDYFVELEGTGGGDELFDMEEGLVEMLEVLLEDMFNMSWTITLPGKIVGGNADAIEGGSGTWNFDFEAISSGSNFTMQSHYTKWPVIGGIIAGGVVLLALVVVFFVIRRRRSTSAYLPGDIVN